MKLQPRVASKVTVLVSAAFVSTCAAPPSRERPPVPAMVTTSPSVLSGPAPPVSTEPAKQADPAPRVGADAAREVAERTFVRLQPTLPSGARLERFESGPTCARDACAWKWRTLVGADSVLGVLEVDAESGAVSYEPNDGRGGRLGIDAFLAREAEREMAVKAVSSLPIVQAYCKKVRALKLGCLIYFDEGPSEESCAPSPPLESSCWNHVYVGEAHESHASRFATFLVTPGTSRVVGASGYCRTVPIAQFRGPGSDCPK